MPEAKRARTESPSEDVWTSTLDYRTKYGYCRYSISAQIEVVSSDGAYIPFKVRPGKRGETEIHIVVNDRIIAAVERIEEFAKKQAVAESRVWSPLAPDGLGPLFKSPLKRDERYPTKVKVCADASTVLTYTTADGETSSGQGDEFLAGLVKSRSALSPGDRPALAEELDDAKCHRSPFLLLQLDPERAEAGRRLHDSIRSDGSIPQRSLPMSLL